jgi:DNA-binding XRE family transcriptional regulator
MDNDTYQPVPHDTSFREQLLSDPEVKAAFDASAAKYSVLNAILTARREAGLTQTQVAERMGTKPSAIARLESALASGKHSPSIETLQKYATAVGKKLEIHLV